MANTTTIADVGLEVLLSRLNSPKPDGLNRWRGPCPVHQGNNRTALAIRLEGDTILAHCYACGAGLPELLEALGSTWADLRRGTSGGHWQPPNRPTAKPKPDPKHRNYLESLWATSDRLTGSDAASRYLAHRGITVTPPTTLRYRPKLGYWEADPARPGEYICVGKYPAMIAPVHDADAQLVALHRTYLARDGNSKAAVPCPKKLQGQPGRGAIRLYPLVEGQPLALTEGIETALAVHQATGWPVWACVSAGGLERVLLPSTVCEVVICADHDPPGLEAAHALQHRLLVEGRTVRLSIPPKAGTDWLNVLQSEKGAA